MDISEKDIQEAKAFGEFFIEKMENHRNTLQYYLSENVVLDWFGQTVKSDKTVCAFLKKTLSSVNHIMTDAVPVKKIGFRDTHVVSLPREPKMIPVGLMTPPRICHQKMLFKTPKKQMNPSTSSLLQTKENNKEKGQCDGIHNLLDMETSPVKRFKGSNADVVVSNLELVESECDTVVPQVKYALMEGAIEFHKPSSKKLQSETKWKRPWLFGSVIQRLAEVAAAPIYFVVVNQQDVMERRRRREAQLTNRNLRDTSDGFQFLEKTFMKLFRLDKEATHFLIQSLVPHMEECVRAVTIHVL